MLHHRIAEALGAWLRHAPHDVFHHDDGGIHDQAEIDGADREQVGGFAADQDQRDGEGQGERDGGGNDQGAAQIAEKDQL